MNPDPAPAFVPDVVYSGDYATFAEARARSAGYEQAEILERTRVALQKVVRGEAAYERDAMTFAELELPRPLLDILNRAADEAGGRLSVLDFGGALGSTYYLCRSALAHLNPLEWSIVEQPAHVACGQREFSDAHLKFYATIEDCLQERRPSVLLLSSVLPYLPEPWTFFRAVSQRGFDWIVLDRMPLIEGPRDRLTVETVSPRIYPASYPAWFFSRSRLEENLPPGYELVTRFDAVDRQLLDGVELIYQGLALRRMR